MNEKKLLAALLGFGFAAACIAFNFGYALLCLVGAVVFYAAASYVEGEFELEEVRDRLATSRSRPPGRARPTPPLPRMRSARVR